jgi:hypothetical protein
MYISMYISMYMLAKEARDASPVFSAWRRLDQVRHGLQHVALAGADQVARVVGAVAVLYCLSGSTRRPGQVIG